MGSNNAINVVKASIEGLQKLKKHAAIKEIRMAQAAGEDKDEK
jgi:ribosomal protein S5